MNRQSRALREMVGEENSDFLFFKASNEKFWKYQTDTKFTTLAILVFSLGSSTNQNFYVNNGDWAPCF